MLVKMSSAAVDISDQAFSQHSDEAMSSVTEERPAKRACIDISNYDDVDLSEFTLRDKGKGKNGHMAYPLLGSESIRFNLTPSDWLQTPFGFDVDGKYEKPSFLGGNAPEKANASEGLSLRVNLQPEQAVFLKKLDEISKTAFAELVDAKWNPLVVDNPLLKNSLCKIGVVLKGADLTKITVVVDNKVIRGQGWSFLEAYLVNCRNFKYAEVKMSVRVKKLWNVAGKAGLGLEATQLVLRPTDRPAEVDLFSDDAALLA